jgi:uncharacterized protein (TIGR00304 family)
MEDLLFALGLILVFTGIILALVATLIAVFSGLRRGGVRGGGLILLGPIPIVFGTDVKALKWLLVLALILWIVAVLLFYSPILKLG